MELKIKEIRKAKNLTQGDLADKVGVSVSYLSELESGKKPANTRRLAQLAAALDVEPHELLSDVSLSEEIKRHLLNLSQLSEADRDAVLRHAEGLVKNQ